MFAFDDTDYKSIRRTSISLSILAISLWEFGGPELQLPSAVFVGADPIPSAAIALCIELALIYLLIRLAAGFVAVLLSNGGLLKDRDQELLLAKSIVDFPNSIAESVDETVQKFIVEAGSIKSAIDDAHMASLAAIEECRDVSEKELEGFDENGMKDSANAVTIRSGPEVRDNADAEARLTRVYRRLADTKSRLADELEGMISTSDTFVDEIARLKEAHDEKFRKVRAARVRAERYPWALKVELFDGRLFAFGVVFLLSLSAVFACADLVHDAGGVRLVAQIFWS